MRPPAHVLDLFAVPDHVTPLEGGQGGSVVAGDLVLSPGRDADSASWLNPVLARLAVRMDERPGRRRRDLRVAVPVPARDGSWVVDGWGASRYEPGTTRCQDLGVLLAAGRVLHAELAVAVPERPAGLARRQDRWAHAERLAWGPGDAAVREAGTRGVPGLADLVGRLSAVSGPPMPDSDQLVHGDLAGNVLLDRSGAPVVIDVAPYWRPPSWAEAVCVLDAVLWLEADPESAAAWRSAAGRVALARAAVFRLLSDPHPEPRRYAAALRLLERRPLDGTDIK